MKKFLVFLICGIVSSALFAQETSSKDKWYFGAQIGVNHTGTETMGFGNFDGNIGFSGDLELGYKINPFIGVGLRLGYDRVHSIFGSTGEKAQGFNALEPSLNVEWNLINTILGYKEGRKNALSIYAGIVPAFTSDLPDGYRPADGTQNNYALGFRAGVNYEYLFSNNTGFIVDAGINSFNDKYDARGKNNGGNGKLDSHINLMVGIRKYFGGLNRKHRSDFKEEIVTRIVKRDTTVIKDIVEKKAPKDVYSIFFTIDKIDINESEVAKIQAVADFMKAHPEKVVFVFGYADKNTGTKRRNAWLAKNRARVIIEQLTETYGISADRIISYDQEGDKVQPFAEEEFEKNRATICVITDLVR